MLSPGTDPQVITRRDFVAGIGPAAFVMRTSVGRFVIEPRPQAADTASRGADGVRTTMSGPMNEGAYRSVELPPRSGAVPSMTRDAADELEHHIHCQCGCTLDVYTCRTTDFTCPVSPAMHQDVVRLVDNGYSGGEIVAAFRASYGDRVLMAPAKEGFNWAGYVTPFVAIAAACVVVGVLIRRWSARSALASAAAPTITASQGTADELARIDAAIRDERT